MTTEVPEKPSWWGNYIPRALGAAGLAVWVWQVETDKFAMDERGFKLWGLEPSDEVTFEELSVRIHPIDRDRVRAAFQATRSIVGSYEIDFRILIEDEVRWVASRGQGSDDGIIGRVMSGIFLDVTGRKQAEEGSELLAGEMSHRVKNLLTIASGLTQMTARSATTVKEMAQSLTQRLTALNRAHDLVRPLPKGQGKAALLGDLISILLAPYDESAAFAGRIRVGVARMGVGAKAATALAMALHELATNSVKYGSLSSDTGFLDVSSKDDGDFLIVTWTETGGPPISEPQKLGGFGSKMLTRSIAGQLAGEVAHDWQESGLVVTIRIRQDLLGV